MKNNCANTKYVVNYIPWQTIEMFFLIGARNVEKKVIVNTFDKIIHQLWTKVMFRTIKQLELKIFGRQQIYL